MTTIFEDVKREIDSDTSRKINLATQLVINECREFYLLPLTPRQVSMVWFAKVLQNWKIVLMVPQLEGVIFEVTHNGDKDETYIDTYRKVTNRKYPDEEKS